MAIAIAGYLLMTTRGEQTQSQTRIAALEKQLSDKEAADAERALRAKQQAQEVAEQRRAKEQDRAEEQKKTGLARGQEPARKPSSEAQAHRDAVKVKAPPTSQPVSGAASAGAPSASAQVGTAPGGSVAAPPKEAQPVAAAAPLGVTVEPAKPSPTPAEHLADADRAFEARRYADGVAILKPLADAGNAQAQVRLGDAYAEGRGVERDAAASERWYEKAALQGDINAQVKLGAMFASGTGAAQNFNLAYVWYGTAARLGSNVARAERDKIAPLLQPAERQQADKLIAAKVEAMRNKP